MSWVVEFESAFTPGKFIAVPYPWQFESEAGAEVCMVKWIFDVPHYKFRVRKEMKNDQN